MLQNVGNGPSENEIMGGFVVSFVILAPKPSAWENIMPRFPVIYEMHCQLNSVALEERRKSCHMKL